MKNSRLAELLTSLSKDEFKELRYYVNFPAVNRNEKVKKIYEYVSSMKKNVQEMTKEELKRAAFGNENVNDVNFRVVITEFVKIIERFLSGKKFNYDYLRNKLYLLQEFRERNCRKSFNQLGREMSETFNKAKEKDAYQYLKMAEFKSEELLNTDLIKPADMIKHLNEINRDVKLSYLAFQLDIYFKMLVIELFRSEKNTNRRELDSLLRAVEVEMKNIKKDHTVIYLKYLSLKMLDKIKDDGFEYYTKLKNFITRNPGSISPGITRQIYNNLLSFCHIKRNFFNEEKFAGEELKLYKKMIGSGILNKESKIGVNEFMNIIDAAISCKESIWAANFVNEYARSLSKGKRESYVSSALERIARAEGRRN